MSLLCAGWITTNNSRCYGQDVLDACHGTVKCDGNVAIINDATDGVLCKVE